MLLADGLRGEGVLMVIGCTDFYGSNCGHVNLRMTLLVGKRPYIIAAGR